MKDNKRFFAWLLVSIGVLINLFLFLENHPPSPLTETEVAMIKKNIQRNTVTYSTDDGYITETSIGDKDSFFKIREEEIVYRKNGYSVTAHFWGPSISFQWDIGKPVREWYTNHQEKELQKNNP